MIPLILAASLLAAPVPKDAGPKESDQACKTNMVRLAAVYDSMAPESAAAILKQIAERGKPDLAASILELMKERQAARVLEAIAKDDVPLMAKLRDRMRHIREKKTLPVAPPPRLK